MGFRFERIRPREVEKAIEAGDREKIIALAKAGGKATAQKNFEKGVKEELYQEALKQQRGMHARSMQEAAEQRHDELLPDDDVSEETQ